MAKCPPSIITAMAIYAYNKAIQKIISAKTHTSIELITRADETKHLFTHTRKKTSCEFIFPGRICHLGDDKDDE